MGFGFWILVAAPKGLFPPDPEKYTGPKLKVAIIGAGLAGMSTAVELLEQGHEVLVINFLLLFSFPIAFCFVKYYFGGRVVLACCTRAYE